LPIAPPLGGGYPISLQKGEESVRRRGVASLQGGSYEALNSKGRFMDPFLERKGRTNGERKIKKKAEAKLWIHTVPWESKGPSGKKS